MHCFPAMTAGLTACLLSLAPGAAYADEPKLAPVPDMYYGSWWHHGMNITITRHDWAPEAPTVIAQWRTYTWCLDSFSNKRNPPPCDSMVGNFIEDGGIASLAVFHPDGQDERTLTGVIVATSDAKGLGKWGSDLQFTMLPGNMLLLQAAGEATLLCSDNTDYSQYPQAPCGPELRAIA
jgi:hypothetical protein